MKPQTYSNHRRYVPMYHGVLGLLLLAIFVGSHRQPVCFRRRSSGSLQCLIDHRSYAVRIHPVLVQPGVRHDGAGPGDPGGRDLRHFAMTGKLFDRG